MKRSIHKIVIVCFSFFALTVTGQESDNAEKLKREAREHIREGNKLYNQLKFDEAEILYKKALTKNPDYPNAQYNLGNTIYQQDRNKEAVSQFDFVRKHFETKEDRAQAFHNMGNSFMKEKQYKQAVEAFKNSLRNNSKDEETRYNYALAKELLEEQQNSGGGDNKDQQDQNKNQDGEGKENQDQQDKEDEENKDNKEKENEDGNKDQQDQNKDQQDQEKEEPKPQQRKPKLSPEQIKQLLEAMNNEENKTQKKMNAQKAKGKKVKQEKDW